MKYDVVMVSCDPIGGAIGAPTVASLLIPMGVTTKLIQFVQHLTDDQLIKVVDRYFTTDKVVLGVSTTFLNYTGVLRIQQLISLIRTKHPKTPIVVGGPNKPLLKHAFPNNSIFILGNNTDQVTIKIFAQLLGKDPYVYDFSKTRIDYRKLYPAAIPGIVHMFEFSRGCAFNCAFCDYIERGTPSRFKTEKAAIEELTDYYNIFNNPYVYFTCSTLNDSVGKIKALASAFEKLPFTPKVITNLRIDALANQPTSVIDFCQKYIIRGNFGIETLNAETSKLVNKYSNTAKIKQALLDCRHWFRPESSVSASFIVGLPKDTYITMKENFEWLAENNVLDFTAIFALQLAPYNPTLLPEKFSKISLNPGHYGYSLQEANTTDTPLRQITSTAFSSRATEVMLVDTLYGFEHIAVPWVRDDGYTFTDAVKHATEFRSELNNTNKHKVNYAFMSIRKTINGYSDQENIEPLHFMLDYVRLLFND